MWQWKSNKKHKKSEDKWKDENKDESNRPTDPQAERPGNKIVLLPKRIESN